MEDNICRNCGHSGNFHFERGNYYTINQNCKVCKCTWWKPKLDHISESGEPTYNTDYESEIICPYCGEVQSDPGEYNLQDESVTDIECGHCQKTFEVECRVDVTYSTWKPGQ